MKHPLLFTLVTFLITGIGTGHAADDLKVVVWNVESGGNDPTKIAERLIEFDGYHIIGLTEVIRDSFRLYHFAAGLKESHPYRFVGSQSGNDDRLFVAYDSQRLSLNGYSELINHRGTRLSDGYWRRRSPLVCHFYDKQTRQEFLFVLNHFERRDEEFRRSQAKGLSEWAKTRKLPIIAAGDFNFDWSFPKKQGNQAFQLFMKSGAWQWVKPEKLIDTNWADFDRDGKDDYPDSMLDFVFVANQAQQWNPRCRVITQDGDFPDDRDTSDHRPVECVFTVQ